MWYRDNFFRYTTGIILILFSIFLLGQLKFFLIPFQKVIGVIFLPILFSGAFYYLLRPLLRVLEKIGIPKTLAIIIIYSLTLLGLVLAISYAGSFVTVQLSQLLADLPGMVESGRIKAQEMMRTQGFGSIFTGKILQQLNTTLQRALPFLIGHFTRTVNIITDFAGVLALVPFILFYFLKEDSRITRRLFQRAPEKYRTALSQTMKTTDGILATYIVGQVILALMIGVMLFVGYLILGVRYPLILALFALITSFIPMFGAIIGALPALLIGLSQNPWMILKILGLIVLVQFVSGQLVSPNLIGKRLKIHPLTIIFIFLAAASLFGFTGVLIAVPVYAVVKNILKILIRFYREQKSTS